MCFKERRAKKSRSQVFRASLWTSISRAKARGVKTSDCVTGFRVRGYRVLFHMHVHTSRIESWLGSRAPITRNGVKCAVHKWVTFPRGGCTPRSIFSFPSISLISFLLSYLLAYFAAVFSSFSEALDLPRTWLGLFNHLPVLIFVFSLSLSLS